MNLFSENIDNLKSIFTKIYCNTLNFMNHYLYHTEISTTLYKVMNNHRSLNSSVKMYINSLVSSPPQPDIINNYSKL